MKSGEVEILDESTNPPKVTTVHHPGEFTGDVSQLCGTHSIVSAVARGNCEVYEIRADSFRQIMIRCPDLADLTLQAFIARRQLLRDPKTFSGLRVIGSRYSPDTLRMRAFLARNQMPFTWLDLESEPQVDQLLARFGAKAEDTPVVAWGQKLVLRNPSNRDLAEALGLRQSIEANVRGYVSAVGRVRHWQDRRTEDTANPSAVQFHWGGAAHQLAFL